MIYFFPELNFAFSFGKYFYFLYTTKVAKSNNGPYSWSHRLANHHLTMVLGLLFLGLPGLVKLSSLDYCSHT